jgi:hypothetical protein
LYFILFLILNLFIGIFKFSVIVFWRLMRLFAICSLSLLCWGCSSQVDTDGPYVIEEYDGDGPYYDGYYGDGYYGDGYYDHDGHHHGDDHNGDHHGGDHDGGHEGGGGHGGGGHGR